VDFFEDDEEIDDPVLDRGVPVSTFFENPQKAELQKPQQDLLDIFSVQQPQHQTFQA
jgi:hypothetical protein